MSEQTKAEVLQVGAVTDDGRVVGWRFDCKGSVAGLSVSDEGVLYCGYTVEELREISEAWPDELEEKP